jgi:hypothetical protein
MNYGRVRSRFELLKWELSELHQRVGSFDVTTSNLRGWAVTIVVAAAGFAVSRGQPTLSLLGWVSTGLFWVVEAHQLVFRRRLLQRALALEDALADGTVDGLLTNSAIAPPRLALSRSGRDRTASEMARSLVREAVHPRCVTLYAGLAVVSAVVALRV